METSPRGARPACRATTSTVVQVGEIFTSGTDAEKAAETQRLVLADDFQSARAAVDDYVAQSCDA